MAVASQTAVKAAQDNLGAYLLSAMPSLAQVLYEFPGANQQLKYPSISLSTAEPMFSPMDPYILSVGAIAASQRVVKYVTGAYDIKFQLDLWARDKVERYNLLEEFFLAINPSVTTLGLSRKLTAYHDIWCRYDFTGYKIDDSEGSSQRAEWRARIELLANTRAVIAKTEYIMETIENNLIIEDSIIV